MNYITLVIAEDMSDGEVLITIVPSSKELTQTAEVEELFDYKVNVMDFKCVPTVDELSLTIPQSQTMPKFTFMQLLDLMR
ncbi:MAG TPA: hypothetical protein VNX68_13765 [Nitrosopumilaceae archaeon]|jgi:hypothetical protein|nr:hypothetical protein [Nitrosopumilaceae archaeon]